MLTALTLHLVIPNPVVWFVALTIGMYLVFNRLAGPLWDKLARRNNLPLIQSRWTIPMLILSGPLAWTYALVEIEMITDQQRRGQDLLALREKASQ